MSAARELVRWRLAWLSLWAPVVLYAAGIFIVSSLSQPPGVPAAGGDKMLHGFAYAGLATLLVRGLSGGRWAGVTSRVAIVAIALATLYGASDEWHQAHVPGRTPEAQDIVADAVGASLGALACLLVAHARRRRPTA